MMNEFEEMCYLNRLTARRSEERCRREWMTRTMIQWGGWLVAGVILVLELALRVS